MLPSPETGDAQERGAEGRFGEDGRLPVGKRSFDFAQDDKQTEERRLPSARTPTPTLPLARGRETEGGPLPKRGETSGRCIHLRPEGAGERTD